MAFNHSFFWSLWHERNERYFKDNCGSFEGLFDLVLSILYFGVKVHTPLEISLTALLNIWISFLLLTFVGYPFHLSRKSLCFSSKKKKTSLRCIRYWQCSFWTCIFKLRDCFNQVENFQTDMIFFLCCWCYHILSMYVDTFLLYYGSGIVDEREINYYENIYHELVSFFHFVHLGTSLVKHRRRRHCINQSNWKWWYWSCLSCSLPYLAKGNSSIISNICMISYHTSAYFMSLRYA